MGCLGPVLLFIDDRQGPHFLFPLAQRQVGVMQFALSFLMPLVAVFKRIGYGFPPGLGFG